MQAFNFPLPEVDMGILPIAIVAITGIMALIVEMIRPNRQNDYVVAVSLVGLFLAAAALATKMGGQDYDAYADTFKNDTVGNIVQLVIVVSTFLCVLFSESYLRNKRIPFGEFYPLVLWAASGAMIMSTTYNLLVIFLGLEILSVSLYVLAGMSRQEQRSEESAMKYFLLGAFASGFLLFGIAFIYGAGGDLALGSLGYAWRVGSPETKALMFFGFALMLVGIGFKSSLVPFHQWTPDVYQGAPTNVSAFMATVSKVAALTVLLRILDAASFFKETWLPLMMGVAVLTMLVGNLVALTQKDVKRILAYSSISHAGYVLVGIMAHAMARNTITTVSICYYFVSYCLMTIGTFAVLSLGAKNGKEVSSLSDLRGLYKRSPVAAVCLLICILSLIGIPPSAGFIGKLMIFNDAVRADLTPLAIVMAISSAISVYYYLAIATSAFATDDETNEVESAKPSRSVIATCVLCAGGVIAASLFVVPLMHFFFGTQ